MARCVLSLCTALAWRSGMFVRLGVASMGIMLVHKFFVLPIQLCYGRLADCGTVAAVLTVIVSLAIVTAVAYAAAIVIRRFIPAIVGER